MEVVGTSHWTDDAGAQGGEKEQARGGLTWVRAVLRCRAKMKRKPVLHVVSNSHLDPAWLWDWHEGAACAISTLIHALLVAALRASALVS